MQALYAYATVVLSKSERAR